MDMTSKCLMCSQVSDLQAGQTFRFRVSAVNEAGMGHASLPSEPVTAQTKPGQPAWFHTHKLLNNNINPLRGTLELLDLQKQYEIMRKSKD